MFPPVKHYWFTKEPDLEDGAERLEFEVDTHGAYRDVAPWVDNLRQACLGARQPCYDIPSVMLQAPWTEPFFWWYNLYLTYDVPRLFFFIWWLNLFMNL